MDIQERIDLNEVIIQGPIIRKDVNDIATNFRIKVARGNLPTAASSLREDAVLYNWPEVAVYDPLLKVKAEAFDVGDEVCIKAYVSVAPKTSKITGRMFYDQKLVAVCIEKAVSVFDDGEPFDCPSYCKFRFSGAISNVRINKTAIELNIRTITHKSVNNIQTFMYSSDPEEMAKNFMVGERLTVIGNLQTPRKVTDGVPIIRRNYIISRYFKEDTEAAAPVPEMEE